VDRVSVREQSHRLLLQRNLRGNSAAVTRPLRRPLQSCLGDMTDPIPAISNERLFHVCSRRRLETNSVAVEVESAAGRRLCVFGDGLRERVARLSKRIFACDGLRVPVKELSLAVDV